MESTDEAYHLDVQEGREQDPSNRIFVRSVPYHRQVAPIGAEGLIVFLGSSAPVESMLLHGPFKSRKENVMSRVSSVSFKRGYLEVEFLPPIGGASGHAFDRVDIKNHHDRAGVAVQYEGHAPPNFAGAPLLDGRNYSIRRFVMKHDGKFSIALKNSDGSLAVMRFALKNNGTVVLNETDAVTKRPKIRRPLAAVATT